MDRPTVAVDVDGVLLNFDAAWHTLAKEEYGPDVRLVDSKSYTLGTRYGLTQNQVESLWKKFDWSSLPAYNYANVAMDYLRSFGCKIVLITCIDPNHRDARIENLEKHNIHFDDILIPGFGSDKLKDDYIKKIRPVAFIDDVGLHCQSARNCGVPYISLILRDYSFALGGGLGSADHYSIHVMDSVFWVLYRLRNNYEG